MKEMEHYPSYDIVISGAGIIGAALGCALAPILPKHKIAIVDPQENVDVYTGQQFDPRVVALSDASIQFLDSLGIWPEVLNQRACPYGAMHVKDREGTGAIEFDASAQHLSQLGYIVENSVVVTALRNQLQSYSNVQWFCSDRIVQWRGSKECNLVTLESGVTLRANLIVAADGAQSTLRSLLNLPARQWDYHHTAIVTTIRTECAHDRVARQWFSHSGPLAFLPLPASDAGAAETFCSIVWSQDTQRAEELMALDDADFCLELNRASEGDLGRVTWVDRRQSIPLHQSHALQYGQAGVALVGDAAHRVHPLAGQGANLGLYDVQVLAQEIDRAVRRQVPLQHVSVVERFQRQRKLHNLSAVAAMEGFKRLFASQLPAAIILRNLGLNVCNGSSELKKLFVKAASGHRM